VTHQLLAAGEGFDAPGSADFWQPLIGSGSWAITRPAIVLMLSVVVIAAVLAVVTRRMTVVPGKAQFMGESVYGFVRNGLARDVIGSKDFLRFVPLLFTQFLLILVNNVVGVIPPIQYPTTSRIGFPIALTIITFVVYHTVGVRKKGLSGYFKGMVPAGLPSWIVPFIFVLELVTYFITRPLTLAVRLFANMFAGHLLLLVFILGGQYLLFHGGGVGAVAAIPSFLLGLIMMFFELLVEFLQAYIFVLLTALYIAGSLAEEH
jgi:F-type H+-transporting ATPase subunit a